MLVTAVINSGPREDSTRIGRAGTVRRQAVDVSPLRRVNQAISLLTTGAREASFRNIKTIAECLADELMNAAKVCRQLILRHLWLNCSIVLCLLLMNIASYRLTLEYVKDCLSCSVSWKKITLFILIAFGCSRYKTVTICLLSWCIMYIMLNLTCSSYFSEILT